MAYAQWIEVELAPGDYTIQIENAQTSWGKFYQLGDKDDELSASEIDSITIPANGTQPAYVCACGREDSPSGTEGSFEIWDGQTRVGQFQWDCPWGAGSNSFSFQSDAAGYATTLSGGNSGSSGPIGPVTLTTQVVPTIILIYYQGGVITLNWTMPGLTTSTSFEVTIKNETTGEAQDFAATGYHAEITHQLDANATYHATLTLVGGATSPPVQIITASTQLTLVQNALQSINLNWNAVAGYTYSVTLAGQSPETGQYSTPTASFALASPLSGTGNTVSVRLMLSPNGATIVGPPVQSTIVTAVPVMTQVVNTGSGLQLAWGALPQSATYRVSRQQTGAPVTETVTATGYTFAGALTGTGITCWVAAVSSDGIAVGPPSQTYTAIVGQARWQLIANDGGSLALSWAKVADASATGYLIEVEGLSPSGYPVGDVAATNIAATLTPMGAYSATVRATNGIVMGPPSGALAPLTAPPAQPRLGFDGSNLRMSWQPSGEAGGTGYAAELLAGGEVREQASPTASPQVFQSGLDPGVPFAGKVRATGPQTAGPWSAIAVGPYRTHLDYAYDGQARLQSVQWTGGASQTYAFDAAGNLLTASLTPGT